MIVCRTCGGHNADGDTFCGSCGEFLEWTGEKLDAAPEQVEPAREPEPALDPEPTVETERAVTASTPAATGFKPAVPGPTPPVTGFKQTVPVPRPAVPESNPTVSETAQRAAALVAPPPPSPDPASTKPPSQPDSVPVARKPQPQEMRPQAPVRRRPTAPTVPSPPTRQPQPDDLICGMCGEGNPPTRRFCSRCGESLQTATVVPTPWWRQILKLFERKVHPAGARPKRRSRLLTLRGVLALVRRTLLVAVLLAGLLYAISPSMRGVVKEQVLGAKDWVASWFVPEDVAVRPISVSATAQLPDHPADQATDLVKDTFWAAPDAAAQPKLVLTFDHPTRLVRAIVHNGGGEDFQALGRPRELHVEYFTDTIVVGVSDVTLEDTPEEQQVTFTGGDGATRVEIQVMSTHPAEQSPGLALSEIELFERQ
ncbi:MAG: NADase-type glycan-binding domain-containing protein [Pseudonocardiaceae bacterium]